MGYWCVIFAFLTSHGLYGNPGKSRREKGDFTGAETVLKQLKDGPPRRRVGFFVEGAPARRMSNINVTNFCSMLSQRELEYLRQTLMKN